MTVTTESTGGGGTTVTKEANDRLLRVVNPATGETLDTLPAATAGEVDTAVDRAHGVFDSGVWAALPPRERAAVLLRLAELMERDAEILARLDCEDAGKPITECRTGDVPGAIE
jgi:gamma-glutamyl-gamma-aminobutyraldehyde dehydrogenase